MGFFKMNLSDKGKLSQVAKKKKKKLWDKTQKLSTMVSHYVEKAKKQ